MRSERARVMARGTVREAERAEGTQDAEGTEEAEMAEDTDAQTASISTNSRDPRPHAVLRKWNPWKVRAFGEADFCSADHAWLFRMSILAIYTV